MISCSGSPSPRRGRRLTFSHGILALSALGALLLIVFHGVTDRLIPLFASGAFLAFTMSQAGMVAHWRKQAGAHARRAMLIDGLGALTTFATLLGVLVAKFAEGAWISLLLIGGMMTLFLQVRRHYDFVARATAAPVPTGDRELEDLRPRWSELAQAPAIARGLKPPRLEVLRSHYRELFNPLLRFVSELAELFLDRQVAVVIPELVEPRWYHHLLHNHTASVLRALLIFRGGPQIVVISAPWYLADWIPERERLHGKGRRRARSLLRRAQAR